MAFRQIRICIFHGYGVTSVRKFEKTITSNIIENTFSLSQ